MIQPPLLGVVKAASAVSARTLTWRGPAVPRSCSMLSVYIAVRQAPGAEIAAARTERVRSLDPDIAGVEREGVAAFDAVPLEALQEELRHDRIAVVGIEDIDVGGPEPGALVHSPGGAVGPVLDLVQIFLGAALPEIVLRVVEHIDRRLLHVAGALGGREEIRGRGINRPVAVPHPERVQDVARIDVLLDRELRHVVAGVEPPRRHAARCGAG